ncbi:helix-turn-helix domain-containing protein [Serratia quinivorans]|uniref:helix-turn-helix domain-containing protein n=1 Tax=Serratia quinivorans TaxID=137545 RepID=UPI002177346B|nr:helix-turn-helix transcriptional regulator [Serratia quinivorans]CAI1105765.1 Helix-turn-helix [Serratia quinivorans]CAI2071897.1 Helix-turn-helix [Serratia quinivorans]
MKKRQNYHDIFCMRLKQARIAKGLSQKALGIAAGIDEFVASTRINRYEKGVHEVNIETAQLLANVLEVPLAYLYTADNELAELMLLFLKMSPNERSDLLKQLQSSQGR